MSEKRNGCRRQYAAMANKAENNECENEYVHN